MTTITYRDDIDVGEVERYACQYPTIKHVANKLGVNPNRLGRYIKNYPEIGAAFERGKSQAVKKKNEATTHPKKVIPEKGSFYKAHPECYLKEAHAMLEGKHWQGKNRCVKLPGDDEPRACRVDSLNGIPKRCITQTSAPPHPSQQYVSQYVQPE